MGLIQNIAKGLSGDKKEFKKKFKQEEEDMKIQRLLEERQKSSNQREVERYIREEKEEEYKRILEKINKGKTKELWKSEKSVIGNESTMLKDDRPILKEKNIFVDKKNKVPLQNKREGMFFRW